MVSIDLGQGPSVYIPWGVEGENTNSKSYHKLGNNDNEGTPTQEKKKRKTICCTQEDCVSRLHPPFSHIYQAIM
jgi:hypothetical protein